MKRRQFVAGLGVFAGGIALGGWLGRQSMGPPLDFRALQDGNSHVKFRHLPPDLLIKLYSRNLKDEDREALLYHLVNHNRSLFVVAPKTRTLGTPGFYRVTG